MQNNFYLPLLFAALLFTTGSFPVFATDAADPNTIKAQQMIEKAEAAQKKAGSVGGEWRDTAKMIKQAKAKLAKGDAVAAMRFAAQAHKQAALGYQQATSQQQLKMPSYLRY
jgi:hypothetical protein